MEELTGYEDCNFRLSDIIWETGSGPSKAILKVSNPLEAKCDQNIDFQIKFCRMLNEKGISCPTTIKRLDGREWAREEIAEGVSVGHIPYIAVEHRRGILKEMKLLLEQSIISKEKAKLVAECLEEFDNRIAKHRELFETGLIHSDINETNVLMIERNGHKKITGLLDFGDVHESFRIVDIASTVLYLYLSDKQKQGVESLTNGVLEGYHRVREVPDCTHLITAMKARLSCSLIYGLRTARLNFRGGSVDYVLRTQSNGWSVLQELHHGDWRKINVNDSN
ncbi:hypothetical protein TELCIR_17954 [Teladorsagia circumcincta]|uniref:Hydroxylysine kinase n=1 Tax=Teladorsagia circumcincta TaxID=45464 RepID=A0A2G9TRN7_TELCI|nr:hypothetical protein TELCIR_17954 [Teladorsagia circumcincta]